MQVLLAQHGGLQIKKSFKSLKNNNPLLFNRVAHKLSRSQLENLPETVAADVIARFNEIEEKRKVDMMTPEEKKVKNK